MAGDPETGVTIMRMEEGLDTGPDMQGGQNRHQRPAVTAQSLHDELAQLGARLMVEVLAQDGIACVATTRGWRRPTPEKSRRRKRRSTSHDPPRRCAITFMACHHFPARGFRLKGARIKALQVRNCRWRRRTRHIHRRSAHHSLRAGCRPPAQAAARGQGRHGGRSLLAWSPYRCRYKGQLMPRYKLIIEYDGGPFSGLAVTAQRQHSSGRSGAGS